jgi:hypothetical protein
VEAPSMGVFNVNYNKTEYNQNQSLVLGFQWLLGYHTYM